MSLSMSGNAMPEFVGTTVLNTIGLVIPSVAPEMRARLSLDENVTALGFISSRIGAAGQLVAADEAVKNSGAQLVSVELPRDTKGWGGHGCFITLGGSDVSDLRRAIEHALEEIGKNARGVQITQAGHLELAYSARAGAVLSSAFGIPEGQAFGFLAGSPAAIGAVMADAVLKSFPVEVARMMTPDRGTAHSNEVILAFYGAADATQAAVERAREIGEALLSRMGEDRFIPGTEL